MNFVKRVIHDDYENFEKNREDHLQITAYFKLALLLRILSIIKPIQVQVVKCSQLGILF